MQLLELLKNTFLQPRPVPSEELTAEAALRINFKIVVAEFADNVESIGGETITRVLRSQEGLSVIYFNEPFNKSFLNLESRTLFDLIDKGQTIIEKTRADVLLSLIHI